MDLIRYASQDALSDLELTVVGDGDFELDGGAMFEVVPKFSGRRSNRPTL